MPAGLHQTKGEMEAFHNDTQYMTSPAVNLASIEEHIFGFAELFSFASRCDQYKMTDFNPACYHIFI